MCPLTRSRLFPAALLVASAAALALAGASSGQPKKEKPKEAGSKYALVVGVRLYKKGELRNLSSADKDAKALADLFRRADYRRVVLLTYEAAADNVDLLPTARNIREQLRSLLEDCDKDDRFVFAFLGHGIQLEGAKDYYLCPMDAELGEPKTMVSLAEVYKEMEKCKAGHKLAILDGCFRGPQSGTSTAPLELRPRPQALDVPKGVAALFSCSEGQFSYESESLKQGIFTHYLLEGLKGKAAPAGSAGARLDGLVKHLQAEVRLRAKEDNGPRARQVPKLVGEAADYSLLGEAHGGADLINSVGMRFKLVPKGTFEMGSPATEQGRDPEEDPQHPVEITRPFYLGVYEVTQEEYEKVTGSNPSYFSAKGAGAPLVKGMDTRQFPVERVSWAEAVDFCKRLSELPTEKRLGRSYRLPTEAEWEHACRAGTKAPFHYGAALNSRQANHSGLSPYGGAPNGPNLQRPAPVGSYRPNAWGLYDMHGNVKEWCSDWYDGTYYNRSPRHDPTGGAGTTRTVRGGAWDSDGRKCRSAYRSGNDPTAKSNRIGFRVVCVLASN
jgi:formylglycine-generating enzyme required for sulfatase activity